MIRVVRAMALLFAAMALAACSMPGDAKVAEQEVPRFHQQLDAGKFADIYQAAAVELKSVSSEMEFVEFLGVVHRKLGNTRSAEPQGWNVNSTNSGTFVTLNYKTAYAEGEATERFVYRVQGNVAVLNAA